MDKILNPRLLLDLSQCPGYGLAFSAFETCVNESFTGQDC